MAFHFRLMLKRAYFLFLENLAKAHKASVQHGELGVLLELRIAYRAPQQERA